MEKRVLKWQKPGLVKLVEATEGSEVACRSNDGSNDFKKIVAIMD